MRLNKKMSKGKYIRTPELREKTRLKNLGKKASPETIKKMQINNMGSNNPRYIKDRSKLKQVEDRRTTAHLEWSKLVKERDNWKCKLENGECVGRLEAHHIIPWGENKELRFIISNGITLCKYHHPHGRKKEKEFESIFMELVNLQDSSDELLDNNKEL